MFKEGVPGTHEMAFAFAGVLAGFIVKLILDFLLPILIRPLLTIQVHFSAEITEIISLIVFVLSYTYMLKKVTMPAYFKLYKLFHLLNMGDRKKEVNNYLTEKDLNILVPSITISLIIFELRRFIETVTNDFVFSIILTIFFAIVLFITSYKESEKLSPVL